MFADKIAPLWFSFPVRMPADHILSRLSSHGVIRANAKVTGAAERKNQPPRYEVGRVRM
jgi:hypothetical protein